MKRGHCVCCQIAPQDKIFFMSSLIRFLLVVAFKVHSKSRLPTERPWAPSSRWRTGRRGSSPGPSSAHRPSIASTARSDRSFIMQTCPYFLWLHSVLTVDYLLTYEPCRELCSLCLATWCGGSLIFKAWPSCNCILLGISSMFAHYFNFMKSGTSIFPRHCTNWTLESGIRLNIEA